MRGIMQKKLVQPIKAFLKDDFNKVLVAALLIIGLFLLFAPEQAPGQTQPSLAANNSSFIHFFYLSTCPHCHEQMDKLNPLLEQKYNVTIISHEVTSKEGSALFNRISDERSLRGLVPTTLVGNKTFVGYDEQTGKEIEAAVLECKKTGCNDPISGEACSISCS